MLHSAVDVGASDWTRTSTGCPTATSRPRVYLLRHRRKELVDAEGLEPSKTEVSGLRVHPLCHSGHTSFYLADRVRFELTWSIRSPD
jgi:hypothetical protein